MTRPPAWIAFAGLLIAAPAGAQVPFPHLAASQVGYAPNMTKQFTSTEEFQSFQVVDADSGAVAFTGGAPVTTMKSDDLGKAVPVWIGDFTGLTAPGRYKVVLPSGTASWPFDVGEAAFDLALRAVQRFFYYQRAFTAISAPYAEGPWVHDSDAAKAPTGVGKGWHDAGDLTVYNATMNAAVFWMLEAWSDFKPAADDLDIPESGNGVPDLLDEARWGLEWFMSVQDPATGAFHATTCEEVYTGYGQTTPQNAAPYVLGEPGTIPTGRATGLLAYASSVFRPFDAAFADKCLAAARLGYQYLQAHWTDDTDGTTCNSYGRDGDPATGQASRMFAAAGMLLATGEASYDADFQDQYIPITWISDYNAVNVYAAQIYLRAAGTPVVRLQIQSQMRAMADGVIADGAKSPFGRATYLYWGSLCNGFHRTSFNTRMYLDKIGRPEDLDQALANLHYMLGRNFYQFVFLSGLASTSAGMSHGFHYWLKALNATPHDFPGMVPGGPNGIPDTTDKSYPDTQPYATWGYWADPANPRDTTTPPEGRYTDNDSWSTNEVAINYAGITLYMLYFAQWAGRQAAAVQSVCGDGTCDGSESCLTCPLDCGDCADQPWPDLPQPEVSPGDLDQDLEAGVVGEAVPLIYDTSGSCGCRLGPAEPPPLAGPVMLVVLLLASRVRRRR